jgi:outer membrane protein OmpA-like peptidoglycan-associated protein
MKKIISIFAFALVAMSASAENLYKESKFFDNWYVGIQGGVASPAAGHAFWKDARGAFGVNVGKQLTPVYGLELEYTGVINTACSGGAVRWASLQSGGFAIDYTLLTLNGTINLMNLFGGYKGQPRLFEIQAVAGTGWGHTFLPGSGNDKNDVVFKFGANFNFNVGKEKAWTVALKPAIVYDFVSRNLSMTASAAQVQIFAGVTYHFKNSNGTHSFAFGRGYDQAEVDRLNATINETRGMVADRDQTIAAKNQRIADLEAALKACEAKPAVVQTVTNTKDNLECYVYFNQGKSNISPAQQPNVERIATFLKNHAGSKVVIKGYASPEGSVEINERLARQRAEAVKTQLVNKYKIAADRIQAEGQGVGNSFSEPDWNRVSICTIQE